MKYSFTKKGIMYSELFNAKLISENKSSYKYISGVKYILDEQFLTPEIKNNFWYQKIAYFQATISDVLVNNTFFYIDSYNDRNLININAFDESMYTLRFNVILKLDDKNLLSSTEDFIDFYLPKFVLKECHDINISKSSMNYIDSVDYNSFLGIAGVIDKIYEKLYLDDFITCE